MAVARVGIEPMIPRLQGRHLMHYAIAVLDDFSKYNLHFFSVQIPDTLYVCISLDRVKITYESASTYFQ